MDLQAKVKWLMNKYDDEEITELCEEILIELRKLALSQLEIRTLEKDIESLMPLLHIQ